MGSNALTLWHLLIPICFITPIGAAFQPAMEAKAGFGGYVLALCGGLVVGTSCAAAIWKVVKYVSSYARLRPEANWPVISLSVAVIPWIFIAGLLGRWVSFALLRLVV